jgi:hypothetical protein
VARVIAIGYLAKVIVSYYDFHYLLSFSFDYDYSLSVTTDTLANDGSNVRVLCVLIGTQQVTVFFDGRNIVTASIAVSQFSFI